MSASSPVSLPRSIQFALAVTAGISAGVAVAVTMSGQAAATPDKAPPPALVATVAASRGAAPRPAGASTTGLERRVATLEERVADMAEPASGAEPSPRTPDDVRAESVAYKAQIAERVRSHDGERRDPVWASEAQGTIATGVSAFAKERRHQVEVSEVDCRSSSCTVDLEFASYAEAQNATAGYVTNALGMRCAQTAEVPDEPEDLAAPFKVKVLFFDCAHD